MFPEEWSELRKISGIKIVAAKRIAVFCATVVSKGRAAKNILANSSLLYLSFSISFSYTV